MAEKELLALLEERPKLWKLMLTDKDTASASWRFFHYTTKWFKVFVPKLEVFLSDCVSRQQIKKLIEDLQKERNNVLQWVEETFGYGENEEALARAVCNAIQVFMNRVVLKRLALLTQEE